MTVWTVLGSNFPVRVLVFVLIHPKMIFQITQLIFSLKDAAQRWKINFKPFQVQLGIEVKFWQNRPLSLLSMKD
jgi:hypothetical protein